MDEDHIGTLTLTDRLWLIWLRAKRLVKSCYSVTYLPCNEYLGVRAAYSKRGAWLKICDECDEDPRNPVKFGGIENYEIRRV